MNRKITYTLILASVVVCAAFGRRPAAPETLVGKATESPEGKYSEELKPLFYYTEGIKQARLYKNTELAVGLFDKVLALDSNHAPSYYQAAATLMIPDPKRALGYSIKANEIDSANVWYKGQLGRLYVINGEYNKARDIYENLVEMAPRNPENYSMLAALYQHSGQPYTAIATLDKAEEVLGKDEQLSSFKREMLISLKLYDKAIAETKEVINAYPYSYENYVSLAQLYAETRKDSLAMENYNMALTLNPDGIEVLSALNDYYKFKGDNVNHLTMTRRLMQSDEITVGSKVKYFNEITSNREYYRDNYHRIRDIAFILLEKYPYNMDVIELAAGNMIAYGDLEDALSLYKSRLSDTTTNKKLFTEVIEIETYLQRNDSVNKYTSLALDRFPKDADLYARQGGVLSYLKRDKEALAAYKNACKYADSDSVRSSVLSAIGDIYQQQGKTAKSHASYRKAIALWPDNVMALNNYAYHLSEQGKDLEKALEMSARVMELEPGNGTYIDTYGWILYKLGRYEEARKVIMQALALDTHNSPELLAHYGDVLFALGETYMATVYWNRALKAGYNEKEIRQRLEKAEKK